MKFTIAAISLLTSLVAADQAFNGITVRTGTKFQFGKLSVENDEVFINDQDGAAISFVLKDDGSLQDTNSNKYFTFNDRSALATTDEPDKQFSFYEVYLKHGDSSGFYACPDGDKYYLSGKDCDGSTPVAVYVDKA